MTMIIDDLHSPALYAACPNVLAIFIPKSGYINAGMCVHGISVSAGISYF